MLELDLWWYVVLEQAGDLHGVIRWFKFIFGVFLISRKCEWNLLISSNCVDLAIIVFKFSTCKLLDMDNGVDYDM